MRQDRFDVIALPRRAPAQVRAPRMQLGQRRIVAGTAWRVRCIAPALLRMKLHKIELDVVDRYRALCVACTHEKELQRSDCRLRIFRCAFNAELVSTPRDRNVELGFDLPQVGV